MSKTQTLPDLPPALARGLGTGTEAVSTWTKQAASSVRRHREEMLILAATLAFVVVVALISLPAFL